MTPSAWKSLPAASPPITVVPASVPGRPPNHSLCTVCSVSSMPWAGLPQAAPSLIPALREAPLCIPLCPGGETGRKRAGLPYLHLRPPPQQLTECGHELLGVEVPVAPVGGQQCSVAYSSWLYTGSVAKVSMTRNQHLPPRDQEQGSCFCALG